MNHTPTYPLFICALAAIIMLSSCSSSIVSSNEAKSELSSVVKTDIKHSLQEPRLEFLWETDTVLSDIESAIYDPKQELIYTSSINGNWLEKGGVGYLSRVNTDGGIVDLKWVTGLEGPTGMCIYDNKIYVADFEYVVEVDMTKGLISNRILVEGTERINDLTSNEDGIIYGTGTLNGKLFSIDKESVSILSHDLNRPNGILSTDVGLLIGATGNESVDIYKPRTGKLVTFSEGISNADGITAIGNGDYLVSSWQGLIHYVYSDGRKVLVLDTTKEGVNSADICYLPAKNLLLVPAMLQNKLMAYSLVDKANKTEQ